MRNLFVFISLFFNAQFVFAQKATDDFTGKWKSEEGQIIEISKSGSIFSGTATKDGKKATILQDLQFKEGKWKGTLYNPKKKITANCEMILENADKIKIIAKKGMMSKTVYWTKVN